MKTITVFVSSPGDVQAERTIADRLIRAIAQELGIPVSVQYSNLLRHRQTVESRISSAELGSGELVLCPYFWEYQRFSPELGYQDQIPNTSRFDLVISILWSRLGTKLHPRFRMPDGSEPRSGTEYEIMWAKAQRDKTPGVPALQIYRNCGQPNPPLDPPEKRVEFFRQWDLLKDFFESWEKDSQGQFIGAFNNYNNLEEFEGLFREHFRDFLLTQVSDERQRRWLAQRSQVRRWRDNPFRGLQTFDFEHAPIFAGRTMAIDGVRTALIQQAEAGRPFVLVLGASGSGKSSLVRAGVLPLLIEPGVIEGIGLWRRSVMRPAAAGSQCDMFDALAAGLLTEEALPELADLESHEPVKDLAAELRADPLGVAGRVKDKLNQVSLEYCLVHKERLRGLESGFRQLQRDADAANARLQLEKLQPPRARLALIVDQLEELFTSGFSEELQLKFVSALSVLARSGRVFVLATLRNDFYARYQELDDLVELAKPAGKYDLRPPTPDEVGNMIRLPAEVAGMHFEQDSRTGQRLDEALRDAAAATPESLPLLEHVLSLLYDKQAARGDDLLRWSDYRELGELKGALAKYAETVFSTLSIKEQRAFPLVMRHLVTLGQGEEEVPNRRTVPYRDFVASGETDQDQKAGAKGFVDLFIEKRLLVADTDSQGEVTVSVAHEALLREWQRVKEWLTENREFLRMRDRLDSSLKLWVSRGKQKDDLLEAGLHLAEGEKLVKDFGPSLNREQIDYVYASVAERNRRKKAQAQIRYAVMTILGVLAIIAGFQWIQAERHRQSAEKNAALARAEEAHAKQALASEAEVAGKLQEQLRQASWASFNQAERQFQFGEWREGIALLARAIKFDHSNQVASERFFQELIVHSEKALPLPIASFNHQDEVVGAAFSPDGTRILTASADSTAKLWDSTSGKLIASFDHLSTVLHALFSPDGTRILTASEDNTAKLWDAASGKLIASFQHQNWIWHGAFSADGKRILTASADHSAKLWDAESGKLIASFDHQDEVLQAAFSPDGARILTASRDKTAKLWDTATGALVASFHHQDWVSRTAFSPDGARILTACADHSARLWDAASGALIASFAHQDIVRRAAFSPDGTRILTASADHSAKLWDTASGKLISSFDHQDEVDDATFSPDGARIVTASSDKTAKLWDTASGKLLASFNHSDELLQVAFSPDGARILTASKDKTAKLWDAASHKPIASFDHKDTVENAVFSPNGARFLTASTDHSVSLWDVASGKLIASFAHLGWPFHATFSPDGAQVLTASTEYHSANLWDAVSGKLMASFIHLGELRDAAFSPDGARVVTASEDTSVKLWDVASGKLLASFAHHAGFPSGLYPVVRVAFSPDGTRILTASEADGNVKVWDAASGKPIASLADPEIGWFRYGAFSADGARILAAGYDMAGLWDAASGKLIASFAHGPIWQWFLEADRPVLHFSPDGARILTISANKTAELLDATSGELVASFPHQDEVFQAEFSSDGARILTASRDKTAKLWDTASGKPIVSFEHPDGLNHAAFSPDGARILTASGDNTAKLWDAPSGKLVASFDHQDTVPWAGFSPDGTRILTASVDKTAKLWDVATPVELARQVKGPRGDTARIGSPVSMTNSPTQQVESLSVIASGLEFSDEGSLVAVDEEQRSKLAKQLKDLAQGVGPNARFMRWFFSTGSDRTIFPASDVKIAEWVDNALLTNPNVTEEWVRNALILLPNHPLLHIALAGFETDPKRADFLCSFGLARLPKNGVFYRRAGEMLLAQHRPQLALAAIDKALLADPTDLPAQRLRHKVLDAMPR